MARLTEALPVFREAGDRVAEAYALHNMAQFALDQGRPETALELSQDAIRVCEANAGDARSLALATYRLASAYLALGQLESAEDAFGEVVRLVNEKSDLIGLGYALLGLAETRRSAGAAEAAEQTYLEALDLARRNHSSLLEGQIRLGLGQARSGSGRTDEGRAELTAALAVFQGIGSPPWEEKAARALEEVEAGGPAGDAARGNA